MILALPTDLYARWAKVLLSAVVAASPWVAGQEAAGDREIQLPRVDFGPTPLESDPALQVEKFAVPAARSLIVSREGEALAINGIGHRVATTFPATLASANEAVHWTRRMLSNLPAGITPVALKDEDIQKHFENRRRLPLVISETITGSAVSGLPAGCELAPVYLRQYPQAGLTAHLLGYTGVALPDQHGPLAETEYLWPLVEGRAGMEKSLDGMIRGTDGEVMRIFDASGNLRHQEVTREPKPGDTLILSLSLKMQRLAMEGLRKSGRPGAFVAVDADSGDVLALVSYPSFDPNVFEAGISAAKYEELSNAEEAPLFDRAVSGAYPPGSTFKPFVALAAMGSGKVRGTKTKFPGPGELLIDGRYFKNWNPGDEGLINVKYAMLRSCNTWFYQAALKCRAAPITAVSYRFGLGVPPDLPLPSIAEGSIPDPETYNDPRSLANYAIGQGRVLASPVQLAYAMAALANGTHVPRPRLIQGRVDARTEELVQRYESQASRAIRVRQPDLELVRDGMWAVVNYSAGTAGTARMATPDVYGKTGTSQWSNDGKKASLAWFVGWVDAFNPRIAFAVVTHGRDGERLSGGGDAAPIAASFLRAVYGKPEFYSVTLPDGPSRDDPVIELPEYPVDRRALARQEAVPLLDAPVEFDLPPPRRSFFDLLFGRRR